jgi:hypothetical protein
VLSVGQLVNKSLVSIEAKAVLRHVTQLEPSQYAYEKLVESGGVVRRDHHLQYYVELAEKVEGRIRGPDQAVILSHLEKELGNIRLALERCTSLPKDKVRIGWLTEQGLRLGAALRWFWHCRGREDEGYKWLNSLLTREKEQGAIPGTMDDSHSPAKVMVRAKALCVAGDQGFLIGESVKANELLLESRELYSKLGAQGRKGYALVRKTLGSRENIEESLSIFQEEGDRLWIGESLLSLGNIARSKWEHERQSLLRKSLALFREIGDQEGTAYALFLLGALFLDHIPANLCQEEQGAFLRRKPGNIL